MDRTVEISGTSVVYLFVGVSLLGLLYVLFLSLLSVDGVASLVWIVLLLTLTVVSLASVWFWKSGRLSEHLEEAAKRDLPHDISYDPFAYPGHAAKDTWTKSVERVTGRDDGED